MRIPIYRAGSTPTGEAPGRSFRARASAAPFIREAQAKASVFTAATKEIGEFAATRYKAAREAQINQKLLAGETALREDARRLSRVDPSELGSVFNEGGNPEEGQWALATKTARESLLDGVTDPRSQQVLTDRFNQMELTYRYSLRGAIDTKLDAATQKTRADAATQFSQNIANSKELNEAKLHANNFGINSVRLAQLGLGNPGALKKQEYNALYNGILGNIRAALNSSGTPVQDLEELRLTLKELQQLQSRPEPERAAGRETVLANSGAGRMQIGLLEMLPMNDAAKLLQSLGAGAAFFDAPSAEQQKLERVNKQILEETKKGITDGVSMLQKGLSLPDGYIETLEAQAQQSMPFGDNADQTLTTEGLADLRFLNNLSQAVKGVSNAKGINDLIQSLEAPGITEGRATLGLEFLRGFKADMEKQLKSDPIGYASTVGSVDITPIDLSPQAIQSSMEAGRLDRPGATLENTGIPKRITDAIAIHGHYELEGPIKFLTPDDVVKYSSMLEGGTAAEKISGVLSIQKLFGRYNNDVLQQLSGDAPITMHVAGLISDGLVPEAEIIFKGLEEVAANGAPIEGAFMTDAEEEMFNIIGSAYELLPGRLNAELKKNVKQVALGYYAEVISRTGDRSYQADLWKKAVTIAVGGNVRSNENLDSIGIVNLRGPAGDVGTTILPVNQTKETVLNALENITLENFSAITQNSRFNNEVRMVDAELFEAIQTDSNYTLATVGRENGKILYTITHNKFGATDYGIMTDTDNVDIRFTIEDLVKAERSQTVSSRNQEVSAAGLTAEAVEQEVEKIVPNNQAKNTKKLNGDFLITEYEFAQLPSYDKKSYEKKEAKYSVRVFDELKNDYSVKNIVEILEDYDIQEWAKQNNISVNNMVIGNIKRMAKIELERE